MDARAPPVCRTPHHPRPRRWGVRGRRYPAAMRMERIDPAAVHAGGAGDLVVLDPEHPGFRDRAYRGRRNAIARLALEYRDGEAVPDAPYTSDEHAVWRAVRDELAP